MFERRKTAIKCLFIVLVSALLISHATVAENLTGEENDIIDPINELYGKNITNGEYLEAVDPGCLETLRQDMGEDEFEEFYNTQKYWGDEHPELPYGANLWDENGPVNLGALNETEKEKYGLESALIGGDGYVVLGYMKREIEEGESIPFYKQMPDGVENFTCDLNWINPKSELKLTIFAPDGMMGPYYDDSDGLANGRIFFRISRPQGIESGEWYAVIEAEKTEEEQPFIFLMY
jgi:hypothetical protein